MNPLQYDPIRDYFTSEWATISPLSSDFPSVVHKKITMKRRKERLFNLACIAIAIANIAATVVFVYPGYEQIVLINWLQLLQPFSDIAQVVGRSMEEVFLLPLKQYESILMIPYLVLLAAILWGIDWVLRRGHTLHS